MFKQRTEAEYTASLENREYTEEALEAILDERLRQMALKFSDGSDSLTNDMQNSRNDWVGFIIAYAGRAVNRCHKNQIEGQNFRKNMIKVAALAVAAIEAHDKEWC